jgi:hypothetical protein
MSLRKHLSIFSILTLLATLLCFAPSAARAQEGPGLRSSGWSLTRPEASRKLWTRDGLGYWLNDFKWIGFDDWSFELKAEEAGQAFSCTYAPPVVLLLRASKGDIQPYLGILPSLTTSGGGFDLHLDSPGVMLGVAWSF